MKLNRPTSTPREPKDLGKPKIEILIFGFPKSLGRFSATQKAHAFTLIEMILAVGIAAIVLISINAVFFSALHLREATTNAVDEATPLEQAFTLIRRDLECAVTPNPNPNPNAVVSLSGSFRTGNIASVGVADTVNAEIYTATGALQENEPWADIQRVTYGLKNPTAAAGPGKDLIRTITRNLLSSTTPQIEEQWLLGGVESVQFACYDGTQWLAEWDTTSVSSINTNLPNAVRVQIQMVGKGGVNGRPSPSEMVVPIDSQSRTNRTS